MLLLVLPEPDVPELVLPEVADGAGVAPLVGAGAWVIGAAAAATVGAATLCVLVR